MHIELITVWYNEEYLAPFFLNHYAWVDRIHILLDSDTDDNTEQIALQYHNVSIERFSFPDMMDDIIKARKINEKYRTISEADYVIVVDSDEFIFCNELEGSVRDHIELYNKNLYFAVLWQVYQHESDLPLTPDLPVHLQRRHGDPSILNCYTKPAIARSGLNLAWGYGNHAIVYGDRCYAWDTPNAEEMEANKVTVHPVEMLQGAHWKLFDLDEVTRRRLNFRSRRQSVANIKASLTSHYHNVKAEDVLDEYSSMNQSPIVIKDRIFKNSSYLSRRSIFENILSEPALTEGYEVNSFSQEYLDERMSDNNHHIWYSMVKPQSGIDAAAEEVFVLACSYWKNGNYNKALSLVAKAIMMSPDNICYLYYFDYWREKIETTS